MDGDGDGKLDMRSPADAAMSMASYDCKMLELTKKAMADGRLQGELIPLTLSMYNCGPGNTLSQGQVCQKGGFRAEHRAAINMRAHSFYALAYTDCADGYLSTSNDREATVR